MNEFGLFRAGTSLLHRLPAGPKLIILVVLEIMVAVAVRSAVPGAAAVLVAAVVIVAAARTPLIVAWRQLRLIILLAVVVAAGHAIVGAGSWSAIDRGLGAGAQLLVAVALAFVVTWTTRLSELLAVIERLLQPLRRWGVDPERSAMTLVLAIGAIPAVAGRWSRIREAARARGIGFAPSLLGVPLVVQTLRHADRLGEALQARGFDD